MLMAVEDDAQGQAELAANLATIAARNFKRSEAREDRRKWYVLSIEPRSENIVSGHLIGQGIPVYAPVIPFNRPVYYRSFLTGERRVSGCRSVLKPMFPSYVFSRLDYAVEWSRVRSRPGVLRALTDESGHPAPINDLLITAIRDKERELLNPRTEKRRPFKPGDAVRVTAGPFAAFVGNIERLEPGDRIRLLLDLFGRKTPLGVSEHEIEAI